MAQAGMSGTVSHHARECSGYTYKHLSSNTWSCKGDIVTDVTEGRVSAVAGKMDGINDE